MPGMGIGYSSGGKECSYAMWQFLGEEKQGNSMKKEEQKASGRTKMRKSRMEENENYRARAKQMWKTHRNHIRGHNKYHNGLNLGITSPHILAIFKLAVFNYLFFWGLYLLWRSPRQLPQRKWLISSQRRMHGTQEQISKLLAQFFSFFRMEQLCFISINNLKSLPLRLLYHDV